MNARAIICAISLLALVLVGFGHRPLDPASQAQAEAYVLSGGSFADLCGNGNDPNGAVVGTCIACLISASCHVPTRSHEVIRPMQMSDADWTISTQFVQIHQRDTGHLARAPPVV